MQPDAMSFISDLMRLPEPVLAADDINRLPLEVREAFAGLRMLQESTAATRIACECREHCCTVQSLSAPDKTPKFFIRCPDCGLVEIDSESLKQFSVSPAPVAAALAKSLASICEQVVDARLWRVGRRVLANRKRDIWLARGLDWDDGRHVVGKIARNPTPLVFVIGRVPKSMRKPSIVELPLFARWCAASVHIDWEAIEARLCADVLKAQPERHSRGTKQADDVRKLTAALKEHRIAVRDRYKETGEMLKVPTREMLGKLAGIKATAKAFKSRVSRAFNDSSAAGKALQFLYGIAEDEKEVWNYH